MKKITKEQILEKVIKKIIKNGFNWDLWVQSQEYGFSSDVKDYIILNSVSILKYNFVNNLIFFHPFAKAYWGGKHSPIDSINNIPVKSSFPDWQYHFQQMVLEEDRLKYLEKFL